MLKSIPLSLDGKEPAVTFQDSKEKHSEDSKAAGAIPDKDSKEKHSKDSKAAAIPDNNAQYGGKRRSMTRSIGTLGFLLLT